MIKKIYFTLLFLVISFFLFSQITRQDSLLTIYKTTKVPEKKYEASLNLSKELFSRNKDSALLFFNYAKKESFRFKSNKKLTSFYYFLQAFFIAADYEHEKAILYCDSCLRITNTSDLELQKADCYFSKAVSLFNIGEKTEAIKYFKLSVSILQAKGKRKKAVNGYSNLIAIYQDFNSIDTCELFFKKAISIADTIEDCKVIARLYTNMSALYDKSHKFQISISYLLIALKYADRCDANKTQILLNIGKEYMNTNNYEKAGKYLKDGYLNAYKIGSPDYIIDAAADYALFYQNTNRFSGSLIILDTAIKFIDTVNYIQSSAKLCRSLAWSYVELENFTKATYYADMNVRLCYQMEDDNSLAEALDYRGYIYFKQKKYDAAIKIYLQGLDLAKKVNNEIFIKNFYQSLYRAYDKSKNYEKAIYYSKLYIELNDSISSYVNSAINSEMETKYNSEKKEAEIKLLNQQSKYSALELSKSKQQKILLSLALLLTAVILVFVIYNYFQKRKANILINKQKEELQIQKNLVEEHQKETIDSINYAKKIQYALLAHDDLLKKNLLDYFVLFNPKDIVSGDFYWATEHNDKFYLACCDSTGHGVPGAFMSLLNIGFLSEAIKEKNILLPNEVLNYVRKRLIESIGNDGQQDGMDAILICIEKVDGEKKVTYSAANNKPMLITDNQIVEYPADKMPVGKGERTESFTNHQLHVKAGDMLYLYTDGYADQFGGPKGKKFKYKQLNAMLLENSTKDINVQSELLVNEFDLWKGDLEQVDDVCVIGIRI